MSQDMIALPVVQHPEAAERFLAAEARADRHDAALWFVREKRDRAAAQVPEWEALREQASLIKDHTLAQLDTYLIQFEANAIANGIQVHWAKDAAAHNRIVHGILQTHGVKQVVKSKSMLTEECGLNPYLTAQGIDVIDTDLGERIVQLMDKPPSHIVMPAIHVHKEEVGALFHEKLGTEAGATDPQYLTEAARQHLRTRFLGAEAALTGVNFGIAETGGFVVCTNEGNADLGVHLAPVHIASMGLEKLIPRMADLGVFLRLLARSATGQAVTAYTSHFHAPRPGQDLHLVLVDNGRSAHLGREKYRNALKCIRCGACLNTCPIYRRSGGYSYSATVPGPIGAILTPGADLSRYRSLPFASTLCGSCTDVCPVKIDIHQQLYEWRQDVVQAGYEPPAKRRLMRWVQSVFERPARFVRVGRMARGLLRRAPRWLAYPRWNAWGKARELPEPPQTSFREWYKTHRGHP